MTRIINTAMARALVNQPVEKTTFPWATVATVSPPTVRFANSDADVAVTANAGGPLRAGDRVLCVWQGTALIIVSNASGAKRVADEAMGTGGSVDALTVRVKELEAERVARTSDWKTYEPTWKTGSTSPTVGNGTLEGYYQHIGYTCNYYILFQRGSTTNLGSGLYGFGLPVNALRWWGVTGSGYSSRGELPVTTLGVDTGAIGLIGPGGRISNNYPSGWAAGDKLVLSGTYRTAVKGL